MSVRSKELTPRTGYEREAEHRLGTKSAASAANLCGLFFIGLYLVAASWLFGGVVLWTKLILLAISIIAFLAAMAPAPNRAERRSAASRTRASLRRLVSFPPFWFGLLLFSYVFLQWLNPAWTLIVEDGKWWLTNEGLTPRPNWPSSIQIAPEHGGVGDFLVRFGSVWLIVCAGWILIRTRRSLLSLLIVFAINSFFVAVVAIIQEMQQPDKVLWLYPWKGNDFSGPFFYRNHGGAFFYLSMSVSFGLALYFQRVRNLIRQRSSPGPVFVIFGLVNAGATVASGSRAGWIFGAAILALYLLLATGIWLRKRQWRGGLAGAIIVAGSILILTGSIVASQQSEYLEYHFARFLQIPAELERSGRTIGNEASLQMIEDVKIFGYGADSYEFAFAFYMKDYPELVRTHRRSGSTRTNWVQAHNDPLQMAVELGIVGASILALSPLFFLVLFLLRFLRFREETILWLVSVLLLFAHSFVDLIFMSTVLLALFAFLLLSIERSLFFEKPSNDLQKTS